MSSENTSSLLSSLAEGTENMSIEDELEKIRQQLTKLQEENRTLKEENKPSTSTSSTFFNCELLKIGKDKFKYYTGFTFETFTVIYNFLAPCDKPFKYTKQLKCLKNLSLENQLLLVLIKLRQNFDFTHISTLFGISKQDCSTIFTNWINFMYFRFGSVNIWPNRDVIISNMPDKFKKDFPNTLVIIDGTEIKIQRPSSLTAQSQFYSDYKSCTTLKGLVGIDPRGSIIFASMLFSGAISDNQITQQSGFLKLLQDLKMSGKMLDGDGVMADKGFRIESDLQQLGLQLNIPPFASSSGQMKIADVNLTEKIASHRVHVERAISRVKKFKILDNRVDLSLFSSINQIWFVCCFLTNFMPFLIQK